MIRMKLSVSVLTLILSSSVASIPVHAKSSAIIPANKVPVIQTGAASTGFAQFAPQQPAKGTRLNYDIMDIALQDVIFYLGPSIRRHASKPNAATGTRFVRGHRSAYRLEGSRVQFSFLNDEYTSALSEYRQDLERLGSELDITRLSKNEQLAYWFNLHNITLIEQIALQYPVRHPSKMTINGNALHDAKVLTIKGVALSLRDIRENIVYPNWQSPDTLYGFFMGDIGGPMIRNYAVTSVGLDYYLKANAEEFVNSLRGVHEESRSRKVSKIYDDAKRFYFPNFETDLTAHLLTHANEEVAEEIRAAKPIEIDTYDINIADLKGGERDRAAGYTVVDVSGQPVDVSAGTLRYLREVQEKTNTLRRRGLIGNQGTVSIEDIPTIDIGPLPQENPPDQTGDQ